MLRHYLKIAYRHLLRQKTVSAINVLGLSIGMACCILLFLFVKDELTYDRFHQDDHLIYRVVCSGGGDSPVDGVTGPSVGPALKADLPEVEHMVRLVATYNVYRIGEQSFQERTILVDEDFFEVFSFDIVAGNQQSPLADLNSVVLSHSTAKKYFGDQDPVGQMVLVEMEEEFVSLKVSAVAKDAPENSSVQFNVMRNAVSSERNNSPDKWMDQYLNTFVKLHPGTDPALLESKFPQIVEKYTGESMRRMNEEYNDNYWLTLQLQPLQEIHLDPMVGASNGLKSASNPIYAYVLAGIGFFILIIACINFVNLSLARSLPRSKEIGLRKVVGAGKAQLRKQFMGEAFLMCLLAMIAGFIIAEFLLPFFNEVTGKKLVLSPFGEWQLLIFVSVLLALTALLAGFYPSVVLSGMNTVQVLKGKLKISGKRRLGQGLIVLQFAIAVFLAIMALGISRQMDFMLNKDLGYNPDNLIRVNIPSLNWERSLERMKAELGQEPEFEMIGGIFGGTNRSVFQVGNDKFRTYHAKVGYEYPATMQIPIVDGRFFRRELATDTASVVINETFAKMLGWAEPVGQQFDFWGSKYTVIGVMADYHFLSLHEDMTAMMWHRMPYMEINEVNLRIRPGAEQAAIKKLEAFWTREFPYRPFDFRFVSDINRETYDKERNWQRIIWASSGLAIFIAFTGLFGLASLTIKERTKEIGVRKVLGASLTSLAWLLTNQFNKLVLLGIVVAIPLGIYVLDLWLANFAYRVTPGAMIFLGAACATLAGSVVTVVYQSLKVARANPTEALRYE